MTTELAKLAAYEADLLMIELEERHQRRAARDRAREEYRTRAITHMRKLRGFPEFGLCVPVGHVRSTDNKPVLELSPEEFTQLNTTPTNYNHRIAQKQLNLAANLITDLEQMWLEIYAITSSAATPPAEPTADELAEASAPWRSHMEEQRRVFSYSNPDRADKVRCWPPRLFANFEDMHRFIHEERVYLRNARRARELADPDATGSINLLGSASMADHTTGNRSTEGPIITEYSPEYPDDTRPRRRYRVLADGREVDVALDDQAPHA